MGRRIAFDKIGIIKFCNYLLYIVTQMAIALLDIGTMISSYFRCQIRSSIAEYSIFIFKSGRFIGRIAVFFVKLKIL